MITPDVNKSHKAVRVGFHPGGMYRLSGFSMTELINGNYDAYDIFENDTQEVNNKLQEAKSSYQIKEVIERFLVSKVKFLKRALPFDNAMLELLRLNGNVPIEQEKFIPIQNNFLTSKAIIQSFIMLVQKETKKTPPIFAPLALVRRRYTAQWQAQHYSAIVQSKLSS